jgi:fibronectin type 3 domain-containing protein
MIVFRILTSLTRRVKAGTIAPGAVATAFQLSGEHAANNMKVAWSLVAGASSYQIFHSSNSESGFRHTATVPGNTFDDYGLRVGETYYYQVQAFASNGTALGQSTEAIAATFTVEDDYDTYDNIVLRSFVPKSNLESGGLYHQYNYESEANGFLQFVQQTSTDGFNFAGNTVILRGMCLPHTNSLRLLTSALVETPVQFLLH